MSEPQQEAPVLQKLEGFDLSKLPPVDATPKTQGPQLPPKTPSPYRIERDSATCGNPQDINRMLNVRLGEDARKEMNRILKTCSVGERVDMNIYNDGIVEMGAKGIGKFRIIGRF